MYVVISLWLAVTVTVTENTVAADRDAKVTITYGSVSKEVAVKQLAPATGEEVTETLNTYANKVKLLLDEYGIEKGKK